MGRVVGNGSLMPVLSMQHATMSNKTALDNNNGANTRIYSFAVAYCSIFVMLKSVYRSSVEDRVE